MKLSDNPGLPKVLPRCEPRPSLSGVRSEQMPQILVRVLPRCEPRPSLSVLW